MARVEYFRKEALSTKWIIFGLMIAILAIGSSILLLFYPFASNEKISYFQGKSPILFKNGQHGNALIDGDSIFVPISFVKNFIDESIIFDKKSNSIIITTKNKVIQMPTESLTYYVNEKPVKLHFPAIQYTNGELYVAIEPLSNYYPVQFEILKDTQAVWIHENEDELVHGAIKNEDIHREKLRLRNEPTLQSPYNAEVKKGEKIYIEAEKGDYLFIRKENGKAGYIQKKIVQKRKTEKIIIKKVVEKEKWPSIKGPIRLTWEAVYKQNPNTKHLPEMPGINVVSPTWFKLENEVGAIDNLASLDYVKWAHAKGFQVWGVFSNAFDPKLTHMAFKDYETRQKMIRQLLHYSQLYHLNGLNIDIENVNVEDGPFITQFVREATPLFHKAGLTVSMDITFISSSGNWSVFLEREKLGQIVDYLIVMAYDEHWGTSPVAGSVASLPWVEKNIEKLLTVVPNERLILGVPLYTRLWKEQTQLDGSIDVSSKAMSMDKIKEWLVKNKLKPQYDMESGQNYAELIVEKEKTTYKVWLEDEVSLKKRAEVVGNYNLAGVASWSRFFADETAWTALHFQDAKYTDANNK